MSLIWRIIESGQKRIELTQALPEWDIISHLAMCMSRSSARLEFYSYCCHFIIFLSQGESLVNILEMKERMKHFPGSK